MDNAPQPNRSIVLWEEPDTCVIRLAGEISADEMRRINRESRAFNLGKPYVLGLVDLSRVKSFSAEARKVSKEGAAGVRSRGTAIFGASHTLRVLSSLVIRAHDLFYKNVDHPVRFFATEAEARAWLAERRQALQKEQATSRK